MLLLESGTKSNGDNILILSNTTYSDLSRCHSIPTARWNKKAEVWTFTSTWTIFKQIVNLFGNALEVNKNSVVPKTHYNPSMFSEDVAKSDTLFQHIFKNKFKLWDHQNLGVSLQIHNDGIMLGHDMGTGKTITTITSMAIDFIINGSEYIKGNPYALVLCPKSVIPTWEIEQDNFKNKYIIGKGFKKGSVSKRTAAIEEFLKVHMGHRMVFVAINYESIIHEPLKSFLINFPPSHVILDESHRIKSPGGKTSMYLKKLSPKVKKRWLLTGTPIPNNPMDVYAQFRFMDIGVFGSSFDTFKHKFGKWGGFENRQFIGLQNEVEFKEKFHSFVHVVNTDDVQDLPPITFSTWPCEMDAKTRKHYKEIKEELFTMIELERKQHGFVSISNALVKTIRLQQLASGFVKDDDGKVIIINHSKENALKELISDIKDNEPIVVFCLFHEDMNSVRRVAESLKRNYYELGRGNDTHYEWKEDKTGILGVQYKAGSEGVSFVDSRYLIYYTPTFNNGLYRQSIKRELRPGQERSVYVTGLEMEDSLDGYISGVVKKKEFTVEGILNDKPAPSKSVAKEIIESFFNENN